MAKCGPNGCPGGFGKALPPATIGLLLLQANSGGSLAGDDLRRATTRGIAIALAESAGHPGACNTYVDPSGTRQYVYGLWQISTIHGTGLSPCDPATAAKLFWQLSANGADWAPWKGSAYLPHMPAAVIAYRRAAQQVVAGAAEIPSSIVEGGLFNTASGMIKGWGDALVFLVKFITSPNTWIRLGEVIAGAILVVLGLWFLFSQTKAGQSVNAGVGSAAKVAAVA